MRRRVGTAALFLAAAAAWAGELDDAAKERVTSLVPQLASKTEKTRKAAESALAAMGADALPAIVAASDKLKSDDAWTSLARVLAAMGGDALGTVEKLRPSWPKGTAPRFEKLGSAMGAIALAELPDSPADVAGQIEETIRELSARTSYRYADPKIEALGALGRPAFGRCVRILRDRRAAGLPGVEDHKARTIAKLVLIKLTTPADVPLVGALVRGGAADAAYTLRDVDSPGVGAVFADAVAIGLDQDICGAIEKRAADERVGRALAKWIAPQPPDEMYLVASAALAAGRAGAPEAVAPIQAYIPKARDGTVVLKCHLALVRLGQAADVEAVLQTLQSSPDAETRHLSGEGLNELSGRKDYKGGYDSKEKGWRGNFDEAAKAYRAWWDAAKPKAKYDPAAHKWTF